MPDDPPVMPQDEFDLVRKLVEASGGLDRMGQDAATARTLLSSALLGELARRVLDYENSIDWHTNCTSCARTMDSAYAETVRREAAEATVDALYEYATTYRDDPGMTLACDDILGIIGSEEAGS